jgi:hypothetical protein
VTKALTRRRLLQLLAALGVAVGALLGRRLWTTSGAPAAEALPQALPGPFPELSFGVGVVERFEADYQRQVGARLVPGRWPDSARAQLLLSTDFFRFDADETRVIHYVGFYDPSLAPCSNPLARFD